MNDKKKPKYMEPQVLATGVFKKKNWPLWFVALAAIITAACFTIIAVKYFLGEKSSATYTDYFAYIHNYQFVNPTLIVAAALVVLAILCAIIFLRKRTLIVTATQLTYKKGRKEIVIPFSSIKSIDTAHSSVIVVTPLKEFKFSGLQNKKEIYDTLLKQLMAPVNVAKEPIVTAPVTVTVTAPVTTTATAAKPSLSESKVRYFQNLLNAGVITSAQFDSYVGKVFTSDFPTFVNKQ